MGKRIYGDWNWLALKRDLQQWRRRLWEETHRLLTSSDLLELSLYNDDGYFHRVRDFTEFERMQKEWKKTKSVPPEWIGKGNYPGIWTAMFSPLNTFSIGFAPFALVRFFFKPGYFIFDVSNTSHQELWKSWEGKTIVNPWEDAKNSTGESLKERLGRRGYPSHKKFFGDHNFGALIGYHDYVSPVIVLEASIQHVDFFLL